MRNVYSFLWHTFFLALTKNFMDMHTIMPAMILFVGGSSFHLGLYAAISLGAGKIFQFFFGFLLAQYPYKKRFLLGAIIVRISALYFLSFIVFYSQNQHFSPSLLLLFIFIVLTVFAVSGAFGGISYMDIMGKSLDKIPRHKFFIVRQILASIGVLGSAFTVKYVIDLYPVPKNYSVLLFIAAGLLFVASLGFWAIKEKPGAAQAMPWKETLKNLPAMIIGDQRLFAYILLNNILMLAITVSPFYVSLAQKNFTDQFKIGNYLLLQIIGMLVSNVIWLRLSRHFGYRNIIYAALSIIVLLPLTAIFLQSQAWFFLVLFFFFGFILSAFDIIHNGVLIEITNEKNRNLYTGLSGFGSVLAIGGPLLIGAVVDDVGYNTVFFGLSLVFSSGFFIVPRLRCQFKQSG